ncbi:MAG: dihydrodipicolinate synthase family protein, partial [Oscillospiraceae bacterium]
PSRTGINILPNTYERLSKIKNIIATKEASGDISQILKTIQLCQDNLHIYAGNDDQITPILSLGGIGVISVLANVLPKETNEICKSFFDGNIEKSCHLQIKYLDLINNLFIDVNPVPVKKALNIMGLSVGSTRLPLCEMYQYHIDLLEKSLKKLNLI